MLRYAYYVAYLVVPQMLVFTAQYELFRVILVFEV